jgi:hypothetical protein
VRANLTDEELLRRAEIVARDCAGIVPYFEVMFLHSMLYASGRSLESFERFARLEDPRDDPEYAASVIQEAVGHAAAVSRFFWPAAARKREPEALRKLRDLRGQRLRAAFVITDESPLASRNLRNAWEHFDERLDRYQLQTDSGILLPGCLIENHGIADDPAGYTFKVLDPEAECLVLLSERFFYGEIRDEVARVHRIALEADRNGGRLRR